MKLEEMIQKYKKAIGKVYSLEELEEIFKTNPECEYAIRNLIPLLNLEQEMFCKNCVSEKYQPTQTCRFCIDSESILTSLTCCTGCSKLPNLDK